MLEVVAMCVIASHLCVLVAQLLHHDMTPLPLLFGVLVAAAVGGRGLGGRGGQEAVYLSL